MNAPATFPPPIRDVAIRLLGEPDKIVGAGATLRWGSRGSFKVDTADGVWHDKEANEGGGVLDLVMRERGCDKAAALQWMEGEGLIEPRSTDIPRYTYHDADGGVLYVKARVDLPNQKYQYQHFDGQRWRAGRNGAAAIPYRLPGLLAAPEGAVIYMAEGEKHADKLASWGLVATSLKDWRREFGKYVKGRKVVIIPDNDEPGEKQAADAARLVREGGGKPLIVRLPGLPDAGDIMDWNGTVDGLAALVEDAAGAPEQKQGLAFRKGVSARALMGKTFAPIRWIIDGVLSEGMYVLAGAPKLGKSWLALGWMLAVGSGGSAMGSIPCEQGDVLGLMLEDNERRLQRRIRQMRLVGTPDRVTLLTEWPTIDDGCLSEIEAWIAGVEKPRLIVVDVFARVKGSKGSKETDYDFDYRQAASLQAIASKHGLAVVVVHHTRKMAADDPFDEVSGTRGLTGAADGVLVLKKDGGTQQPVLYGRGRDLEEFESALQFDGETGTWSVLGAAWQVADTMERREIQQVLGRSVEPMSPTEIGERLGKSRQNISKMLTKMLDEGQVERVSTGRYVLVSPVSPFTPSSETRETRETTPYVGEGKPDEFLEWVK